MGKKKLLSNTLKHLDSLSDEEIAKSIADDPDVAPDLSNTDVAMTRGIGKRGKQKADTKVQVTVRLNREIVEHFKASGESQRGWQSRMNAELLSITKKQNKKKIA